MSVRELLLVAAVTTLTVSCGEAVEDEYTEEEAIEAPDRPAPVTATPQADNPVRTVRFEAVDGGHVTGIVRLYADTGAADTGVAGADTAAASSQTGAPAFRLEVILDGLEAGEHAWHIHGAACGERGPIAVAMTSLGDRDGISTPLSTEAADAPARGAARVPASQLTLADLEEGDYSLRVHAAGGSPGPVVACADLSGDDNATM